MDLRGNVTEQRVGNGVVTTQSFNEATGRIESIKSYAQRFLFSQIQNLEYSWDTLGNLEERKELSGGKHLVENFTYDALNRIESADLSNTLGTVTTTYQYDGFGNLQGKNFNDTYDYQYESQGVFNNRLHTVDNGNPFDRCQR
ncbi:hypothetical protein NBRC116188_19670 [Oceaniserpentilla sp. 4NH20-0058]|uniref:hypothetical protein n=1 Tax=Oceaniserpentilla sp. 4NH20-0058 TaxID=3127660 RepID=UPI003106DAA8